MWHVVGAPTRDYLCWTLAKRPPRNALVDASTIDSEPLPHAEQSCRDARVKGAVSHGRHVQEKVAAFAHDCGAEEAVSVVWKRRRPRAARSRRGQQTRRAILAVSQAVCECHADSSLSTSSPSSAVSFLSAGGSTHDHECAGPSNRPSATWVAGCQRSHRIPSRGVPPQHGDRSACR